MRTLRYSVFDIAKHEAGHWISWKIQGGKVGCIEIIKPLGADPKGAATIELDWNITGLDDVISFTRARIITLWAGVYAQTFNGKNFDEEVMEKEFKPGGGGRLDCLKAQEYTLMLHNLIGRKRTLDDVHNEMDQATANIVAENYHLIMKLAMQISMTVVQEGRLYSFDESDVLSILNRSG
ncbi:TPA: hypothetical protein ACG041_003645 [Escherichia coli]